MELVRILYNRCGEILVFVVFLFDSPASVCDRIRASVKTRVNKGMNFQVPQGREISLKAEPLSASQTYVCCLLFGILVWR